MFQTCYAIPLLCHGPQAQINQPKGQDEEQKKESDEIHWKFSLVDAKLITDFCFRL
jgi:hypothetical protein